MSRYAAEEVSAFYQRKRFEAGRYGTWRNGGHRS